MNVLKRIGGIALGAGLVVLGLGAVQKSYAGSVDGMQLSVTPTGCVYSVALASPTAGAAYAFGNQALSATTVSTNPVVLTNTSATCGQFYVFKWIDSTAPAWSGGTGAAAPGTDVARLSANVMVGGGPTPFAGVQYYIPTNGTGYATNGASIFGQGATAIPPSSARNVWIQLEMPTGLSAAAAQHNFVLNVQAQGT